MASDPISRHLGRSSELQPLREQLGRIERLQERYRSVAPERLQQLSRVCAIDGTTVVVCVANGAVAAALRHLSPRILQAIRSGSPKDAEDQELTEIRIEVQVSATTPKAPPKPRGEMPREQLGEVADKLSDGPLKETLGRMARPQSRRTRSKM
jgi:hypothetical protein